MALAAAGGSAVTHRSYLDGVVGSLPGDTGARPERLNDKLGACPQRLSSCSAVRSSSPKEFIVRAPSARRSRARTTEVISIIASIVGVGTASRRARSVKKTRL